MSVEKVQCLTEVIKSGQDSSKLCSSIVEDLRNGISTFLKFTENLGCLLTSPDIVLRRGGSEALSVILMELSSNYLKSQEIELLTNFYCDRMLDHHSIAPTALKAFLALLRMEHLPSGVVSKIFTTVNLHFVCQSQAQPDRLTCYEIFSTMIARKPCELLPLGPDFVCGCLTAIDSERDPRNLMYLFENLPHFFRTFPPGHLLEDAFDAVSCYFPIDFRTNPNEPRAITREHLSNMLLPCLTALPEFAQFAVPLALEKLSSDLEVAKIDSLLLLKECFIRFPKDVIFPSTHQIVAALMHQLRLELNKENLRDRIVEVLVAIVEFLVKNYENEVTNILQDMYNGVQHFLNDINANAFQQTIKIIAEISLASYVTACFLTSKVLPKLLSVRCNSSQQSVNILFSFKLILFPCVFHHVDCGQLTELKNSWFMVTQLLLKYCECDDAELRETAVMVCASLVKVFNTEERRFLCLTLCRLILKETNNDSRIRLMINLRTIAESFPEDIHNVVRSEFDGRDLANEKRAFQCYCVLAALPGFSDYLRDAIKTYIKSDSFEYASFVIEFLKEAVIREKTNHYFLNALHHEIHATGHLMTWWYEGCNAIADDVITIFDDERTAVALQFILSAIVRELNKNSQQEIAALYFQLTLDYSKKFMNSFNYLNKDNDLDAPRVYCSFSIITFESVVNGLLPEVLEESFRGCLTQIIKYLITLAVYCSRPLCCIVACRTIATIFAKMQSTFTLEDEIDWVLSYITSIIFKKSTALKNNAINLLLYTTKALLLSGNTSTNAYCDQLVGLVKSEELGRKVAQGFRMLVTQDEYFLNTSCHCKIKLFYRQRIFSYVVPKMVDLFFAHGDASVKQRCAISTLFLLDGVPRAVIQKDLKKIIPLLTYLLQVEGDTDLINETLRKLAEILHSSPSIFEEYIETFIPKFLLLSRNAKEMKIRIAALECLCSYGKLNAVSVLPFKTKVLYELNHCLDDKKRLVRKEAVKTRTRWFTIGLQ